MGQYIKLFRTHADYTTFTQTDDILLPNVSYCEDQTDVIHYNPYVHYYSKDYLTFVALEDGTFKFSGSTTANTLIYSLDNGSTWVELADNTDTPTVTSGNKILWKGTCTPQSDKGIGSFSSTSQFDVEGNAMSLLFGDDFKKQTSLKGKSYAFYKLFSGNTNVVSAENLSLPATTLAMYCYEYMFQGCTSITTAPELPATTLASSCYNSMFYGCTNLTTAPELPATTLTYECYGQMFFNCRSLTKAPELPATTLVDTCYEYMFFNCSSLTKAPELPATTLASSCYNSMFSGCTSLTTAPELPATTLASSCYKQMFSYCSSLTTAPELPATALTSGCYSGMFNRCTSLTTAPELPITTLASSCYSSMFSGCTSLTTAPQLPATTLANNCYSYMFQACRNLTTAPELPATTLEQSCYYGMFESCTSLNSVTCLATDISASNCTTYWLRGVPSNGTFTKAASMTSWTAGNDGIPTNWTVVDASA